jgi:hypothetical protein
MSDQVRHDLGADMKPMNVFPMVMLLIVVLLVIYWLGGGFAR